MIALKISKINRENLSAGNRFEENYNLASYNSEKEAALLHYILVFKS